MDDFQTFWRLLLTVLTAVPLVLEVSCKSVLDTDVVDTDNERWLADQSNYYFDYIGDAPESVAKDIDLCPRLPEVIPKRACRRRHCNHDVDCRKHNERCCYNGCVRTCTRQQDPPAFVDWIREPRRRLRSGISWLLSGPDPGQELEPCSTTPYSKEEDPLLCPHGYICHVEEPGNPNRGIPNRGYCVPENDGQFAKLGLDNISKKDKENSCLMNKYVLLDGADVVFKGKRCKCKKGFLTCLRKH